METGGRLPIALSLRQVKLKTEPTFIVPFERDLRFVGRKDVIRNINDGFILRRRVALCGIGGIG